MRNAVEKSQACTLQAVEHPTSSNALRGLIDSRSGTSAFPTAFSGFLGLLAVLGSAVVRLSAGAAETAGGISQLLPPGGLPARVHVFEDYETEIEQRWWLRGRPETNNVAKALGTAGPNRRACRATESKDFDDKMGDPTRAFKAVVFNPVPGPPMGVNTRLAFRYWLAGTGTLRVQIYSLSQNYHRALTLTNLPQGSWQSAVVDLTRARRPDGSGGPLAADERIDDIQFYVAPEADLLIDDIILFDAAPVGEARAFPRRALFTGWFDTGQQGAGREWPGDFELVRHEPPRTWKAAKAVPHPATGGSWIRVHLRGARPLSAVNRLNFDYRVSGLDRLEIVLAHTATKQEWRATLSNLTPQRWSEATVDFPVTGTGLKADELRFSAPQNADLLIDNLLLFEPADP